MVIFVDDVDNLPWCVCLTSRKPPSGWTRNTKSGEFVCTECNKPSKANYERLER